jgi:hypothetical protein
MLPAAPILCLVRVMLCAGGLAPGLVFADTGSVAAVSTPVRPLRLAAPADVPPDPASLRPGLSVRTTEAWMERREPPRLGAGRRGQFFVQTGEGLSERAGFIHFPDAGTYHLRVVAAAPVHVAIASLTVYDSGGAPAGGASPALPLAVTAAGWYPLAIIGAAGDAVDLDWQTPNAAEAWVRVPETMLAH